MIRLVILTVLIVGVLGASVRNDTFFEGRIVGGSPVTIEDYPYQVSVQKYGDHTCGGSVLNKNHILTAAHCFDNLLDQILDILLNIFSVRAGSWYHDYDGVILKISKITVHPKYNTLTKDYDVAILTLKTSLTFSTAIQAISLPSSGAEVPDGEMITVTGWGLLTDGGDQPFQLQAVKVPKVNDDVCAEAYCDEDDEITDRMLCAGYMGVGGKDACQGDSGGPAVWNSILVGVVSFGEDCGSPDYPGVYAEVANPNIMTWIINNI